MKKPSFLLSILFPPRCPVCDKPVNKDETVCPGCSPYRLSFSGGARCGICGLKYKECVCSDRIYYDKVVFPFYYTDGVRRSVLKMKFRGRLDLIAPFAKEMVRAANERRILDDADLVCFIPMRPSARFRRGYNQAEELAKAVGKLTGIPVRAALEKSIKTPPQHTLNLARRRGNIIGSFEPVENAEVFLDGKTVIIVDDIVTSGNTLNEAAKTLMIFGAEKVYCMCTSSVPKLGVK